MQWIKDIEDAIDGAAASAVFVVTLPRARSMQVRVGIQGMMSVADVLVSRISGVIGRSGQYRCFARFIGMEVVVVVPGLARLGEISALGEEIRQICAEPMAIELEQFGVDPVVGIAISPDDGKTARLLISRAQIAADNGAMTHTKAPIFFAAPMAEVAEMTCRIEMELRNAIDNRGFRIVFQPQFSVASQEFAAAEVLVRWDHPLFGTIPPSEFIPIAEAAGMVRALGSLVLHEAVIQMTEFRGKTKALDLAVNVSPSQLLEEDFVYEVDDLLKSTGMDPRALTIEITEGELLFDIDTAIRQLQHLRKLGVKTSVDDFGAGFSNLAYLHRLPLDQFKIDRRFVQEISDDPRAETLLRSTIGLGRGLGLEVCVEGVETRRQYHTLKNLGCDLIQGYLFARPVPIEELAVLAVTRPALALGDKRGHLLST